MKESCYERLGVEQAADPQQIKRAYYTLVKKYPPERFPEEYKKLRAAYEILSDEKKRAEYDRAALLPEDAAYLLEQAKKLERMGSNAQAAEVYENILRLHPGLGEVRVALARSLERQGKNGKAISLWEKLCEGEPENAEYAYELALSYDQRGWHKKAVVQYRRALELDGGNIGCWVSLVNCQLNNSQDRDAGSATCKQGIGALRELGRESIRLYAYMAVLSAEEDMAAERYLGEIVRLMRAGGNQHDDPQYTVRFLLNSARRMGATGFVKYIREMAATLAHVDDDLREELDEALQAENIESLEERGYSVLFHDLFATLANGCDCEDCRLDLTAMECNILADINGYRPKLLRLREEHPDLYAMHAAFFNEALRVRDAEKMLYRRLKILSKKGLAPAGLMGDPEDEPSAQPQTVRREGPKVGRNDPCPCGSGKKYKKCCGR